MVDRNAHRVQKFAADGTFLTKWGILGGGEGQFNFPYGVAANGSGTVYVVDSSNHRVQKFGPGLVAVDGPHGVLGSLVLHPVYPNPLRDHVIIRFELAAATTVTLSIYDGQGHLVLRALNRKEFPAGLHQWKWDGRGEAGARVAAGVYFITVDVPHLARTKKAVVSD